MPTSATAVPRNPLRGFQFRVGTLTLGESDPTQARWIAGVQRVTGLAATVTVSETWGGGNNMHRYANPDRIVWEPVTLEQGLALDDSLDTWARAVRELATTGRRPEVPVKRDVVIEVWDPFGQEAATGAPATGLRARRYHLKNAWISKFQPLSRLDGLSSEVAFTVAEIVHEGWSLVAAPDAAALLVTAGFPTLSAATEGPDPDRPDAKF